MGGDEGGHLWRASLARFHAASPLVAVLGVMATTLVAAAWRTELRRVRVQDTALAAASASQSPPLRSRTLAVSFHRAFSASMPVMAIVGLSGVAVFVIGGPGSSLVSEETRALMRQFHTGEVAGAPQQFLWLFTGLNIALLNVYVTRIRAARLGERRVPSFRAYEDIPQGAAIGLTLGVLASLALIAWSGPATLIPPLMVFAVCWAIVVHLWAPIAASSSWKILPFVLALAVIFGDVFRAPQGEEPAIRVWIFAVCLAFFSVLVARLGRRTLT